jgi:hypothetical protein
MQHFPFVEGDAERAVLLHVDAQGMYRNVAKAYGRAFDGVIARQSLATVALPRKSRAE